MQGVAGILDFFVSGPSRKRILAGQLVLGEPRGQLGWVAKAYEFREVADDEPYLPVRSKVLARFFQKLPQHGTFGIVNGLRKGGREGGREGGRKET